MALGREEVAMINTPLPCDPVVLALFLLVERSFSLSCNPNPIPPPPSLPPPPPPPPTPTPTPRPLPPALNSDPPFLSIFTPSTNESKQDTN